MTTTQFGIAGCLTFFDFTDPTKITLNGGVVETIADSSDSGITATQATAGKRPTPLAAEIGAKQTVDFDGGDQLQMSAGVAFTSARTVFVHAKADAYGGFVMGSNGFSGGFGFRLNGSGQMNNLRSGGADLGAADSVVGTAAYRTWCTREAAGVSRNWRLDGVADGTDATDGSPFTDTWGNIGCGEASGSEAFNGKVALIVVYNSSLSDGDCATVEAAITSYLVGGGVVAVPYWGVLAPAL